METTLIKLGGSIITQKGKPPINIRAIKKLVQQLTGHSGKIILVHGTGHIGKPPAIKHGYTKTKFLPKKKAKTALKIKHSIDSFNKIVTQSLNEAGVPAISIHNSIFYGYFDKAWNKQNVKTMINDTLKSDVVPVFYGNFLRSKNGSFHVLSSDELMLAIAPLVKPSKILFLSDVDGVLDKNNKLIPVFKKTMLRQVKNSDHDVSGGMRMKVKTALQLKKFCKECLICRGTRKGILKEFLKKGDIYGTKISLS